MIYYVENAEDDEDETYTQLHALKAHQNTQQRIGIFCFAFDKPVKVKHSTCIQDVQSCYWNQAPCLLASLQINNTPSTFGTERTQSHLTLRTSLDSNNFPVPWMFIEKSCSRVILILSPSVVARSLIIFITHLPPNSHTTVMIMSTIKNRLALLQMLE